MSEELGEYRAKRDLHRSGEPSGGSVGEQPRFVVQRHDASSLHFDVRLEVDGVLVSWAVPKGPSTDPREKRLATRTEDHPLDYADFEGVIPEGYGAGSVVVWDRGTWHPLATDDDGEVVPAGRALADGHLTAWLEGEKLRGGYAFTHARMGGDDQAWLMVKMDDEGADRRRAPARTQPESVLSGRTNAEVAADEDDGTDGSSGEGAGE